MGQLTGGYVFRIGGLAAFSKNLQILSGGERLESGRLAAQSTGRVLVDQRRLTQCLGQHALVGWGEETNRGRVWH